MRIVSGTKTSSVSSTPLSPYPTLGDLIAERDARRAADAVLDSRVTVLEGNQENVSLASHIDSPTPHPAYDGIPSLRVTYENGLI